MTYVLRCAALLLWVLGGVSFPALAQQAELVPSSFYRLVESGDERKEIPWKIQLYPRWLKTRKVTRHSGSTGSRPFAVSARVPLGPDKHNIPSEYFQAFAPRTAIRIEVSVPARKRQFCVDGFYLLARVTTTEGSPLDYAESTFAPTGDAVGLFQATSVLYARPGDYILTLALYDKTTGRINIWRRQFTIPKLNDPVPHLYDNFPLIEFTRDQGGHPPERVPFFPVSNRGPIQIDVVADFSEFIGGSTQENIYARTATLVGALAGSHLQPEKGCVHVTALNAVGRQSLLDRVEAKRVDWEKLRTQVEALSSNTIDLSTLEAYAGGLAFVRERLTQLVNSPPSCNTEMKSPLRIILIVASGIKIAPTSKFRFTEIPTLNPDQLPGLTNTRMFYLRTGSPSSTGRGIPFTFPPAPSIFISQNRTLDFGTPWAFALSGSLGTDYLQEVLKSLKVPILNWAEFMEELDRVSNVSSR